MGRLLLITSVVAILLVSAATDARSDEGRLIQQRIEKLEKRMAWIRDRLATLLPNENVDEYLERAELAGDPYVPDEVARAQRDAWLRLRDRRLPDASGRPGKSLAQTTLDVQKKEQEYDDLLEKRNTTLERPAALVGWIAGWEQPARPWYTDAGHPFLRTKYEAWQKAIAARDEARARVDAHLADHPVDGITSYGELDRRVREYDRIYRKYLEGNAQVRRLVVTYIRSKRERDRLRAMAQSQDKFVIWQNDVGWVYVGTRADFRRQGSRTRGSEVWGGRSRDPLISSLVVEKEYDTAAEAVRALGILLGPVRKKLFKLASPRVTYRADLNGKEIKIKPSVYEHPAFAEFMP